MSLLPIIFLLVAQPTTDSVELSAEEAIQDEQHEPILRSDLAPSPARLAAIQDYRNCLTRESLALERSATDFDDVFAAADTACASAWARLQDISTKELKLRGDFGSEPSDIAFRFTEIIKNSEKPKVRLAFLRLRTSRNGK